MAGNSSVHVENEVIEMAYDLACDALTQALPQLKFPHQRVYDTFYSNVPQK